MTAICIGSIGFLCYFAYDVNSVRGNNKILQKFFLIGTILVAAASLEMLRSGWKAIKWQSLFTYAALLGGICMFGVLIYTLFFALPFGSTYIEESRQRMAYTEGMYAVCRHPGVLWYAGMYLCMAGMIKTQEALVQGSVFILWNIAYVIFQDMLIFPRTFINYNEYKQKTPFLIPNGKSIKRGLETREKGGRP